MQTRFFYDTEFIEDGRTIDLVSIGIVADSGDEYYAVSSEFDQRKFASNPWLMENVFPSLPRRYSSDTNFIDRMHPTVKSRAQIADEVKQFILSHPHPELWAWYGAYDHVALCQLWGRMIDLPEGIPMFTMDLRQEVEQLNLKELLPSQDGNQHNALEDARWLRGAHEWVVHKVSGYKG